MESCNIQKKQSSLLGKVMEWAHKTEGIRILLLTGSQVSSPNADSDVDIIVVQENGIDPDKIVESLAGISYSEGQLIHPIVYSEEQYATRKNLEIYKRNMFNNAVEIFRNDAPPTQSL